MNSVINQIKQFDIDLFLSLNQHHNHFSDLFAVACSSTYFWVPFYLFLFFQLYQRFKSQMYIKVVSIALLIVCSDQLSRIIKNAVGRMRPCHNQTIGHLVHLYKNDCGGNFGFVSSHAANSSALAMLVILIFGFSNKTILWLAIVYAFFTSYSRIMLGRHYPLDIVGGWLVGVFCAIFIYQLQCNFIKKQQHLK